MAVPFVLLCYGVGLQFTCTAHVCLEFGLKLSNAEVGGNGVGVATDVGEAVGNAVGAGVEEGEGPVPLDGSEITCTMNGPEYAAEAVSVAGTAEPTFILNISYGLPLEPMPLQPPTSQVIISSTSVTFIPILFSSLFVPLFLFPSIY